VIGCVTDQWDRDDYSRDMADKAAEININKNADSYTWDGMRDKNEVLDALGDCNEQIAGEIVAFFSTMSKKKKKA